MSKKRVPTEQEIAKKHGVDVDYVVRQAEVGSTVEREHVTDHKAAYGIALQHIAEFPDYYKHLLSMEKTLKKEWEKKKPIKENHIAINNGTELDDEGAMALGQLDEIEMYIKMLRGTIKSPDYQLPGWVQAKLALATHNLNAAAMYLRSNNEEGVNEACWKGYKQYGMKKKGGRKVPNCVPEEMMSFSDYIEEVAAWQRSEGKNKNGGLNEKGRKSYETENPGSDLKAPSKEVGNPRRQSFCSRMKGMKSKLTSSKTANDPNSRINKSLRAWNC
jgi:hypothetical protein